MVYIRSVAVWIRDMRTPPEVIAAAESERLASVCCGPFLPLSLFFCVPRVFCLTS